MRNLKWSLIERRLRSPLPRATLQMVLSQLFHPQPLEREESMIQLTQAHRELFRRSPDEMFDSFEALVQHCRQQRERSADHWYRPLEILPNGNDARLRRRQILQGH